MPWSGVDITTFDTNSWVWVAITAGGPSGIGLDASIITI
jgi:hypothetical protein